ncbi:hypothetical protein NOS3756_30610 [Nostoc sp. NIES-3756]|uniref:hypothetical protein n=1 Tax=Nostoc sp. NIES-3756 TaxID=1751286 RepID=UPI000722C2A7|nr:hypothetical protein [Nostoc sp. NIES-3756]BAT54096.1 hypothetical protein NOS3756_30610 [Nostoc sp. NIES-3756]BAY38165.1 hypothetical protein NIES2111_25100 [Nostoc sp. NIES-2111]
MRITTGSVNGNQPKPNSQAHPSSVPLYVYRELAVELKATQDKLDALTAKNQQLAQENQMLRHEISQVVQSFLHLQKVVDHRVSSSHPEMKNPSDQYPELQPRPQTVRSATLGGASSRQPVVPQPPSSKNRRPNISIPIEEIITPTPETVLIEEQEVGYSPFPTTKAQPQEFKNWWLVICIILIMLSAFGAGYLIVRPLFEHQSR